MFIGHYAPALAVRKLRGSPSLALGFIAVQLVDIGFFSFAYFGIERWRPDPAIHGIMPVDLYYMPLTHSLLGSVIWAVLAGLIAARFAAADGRWRMGAIVALLVLSHWFLDLIVHRHDLGLIGNDAHKFGFGLWDYPFLEMPLEMGLVLGGLWLYCRSTRAKHPWGSRAPWIVLVVLLGLQFVNWFAPVPTSAIGFTALGLSAYAVCAGAGWFLDRTRERASRS